MARNGKYKTPKPVRDSRVDTVLRMLVEGYSRSEVLQYAKGSPATEDSPGRKPWGLATRQIDRYIAAAHAKLAEEAEKGRPSEFGKAARRLEHLYRRTNRNEDHSGALAVTRERIKLFGLAAPERQAVDVTSGGEPLLTKIVLVPKAAETETAEESADVEQ